AGFFRGRPTHWRLRLLIFGSGPRSSGGGPGGAEAQFVELLSALTVDVDFEAAQDEVAVEGRASGGPLAGFLAVDRLLGAVDADEHLTGPGAAGHDFGDEQI